MFFKINQEKFKEWLQTLKNQGEVYIPTKENNLWVYVPLEGQEWPAHFLNTRLPAKNLFFPNRQALLSWKCAPGSMKMNSLAPEGKKRFLVGLRPCDSRGLQLLKPVFGGEYADILYLKNLERTILIGLACPQLCPGSFCREMQVNPQDSTDNDIFLRATPEGFVAKVITERGKVLLAQGFFSEAEANDWAAAERKMPERNDLFNLEVVKASINSFFPQEEFWQKVSAKCLNCGICTYLCPTCHCFDICDLRTVEKGVRFRCYDSCAFANFTKMAVHNPRAEKWRRYRQRVSHKFNFFFQNFKEIACVGCGRCVNFCPVNLDLREILKAIH
ncbi:MAG: 4Fe-4S dicluster domain-containing protein [Thermodesulfobacteriota bacterium]